MKDATATLMKTMDLRNWQSLTLEEVFGALGKMGAASTKVCVTDGDGKPLVACILMRGENLQKRLNHFDQFDDDLESEEPD